MYIMNVFFPCCLEVVRNSIQHMYCTVCLLQEDRDLVVSVISDKLSNVNESFTPLTSSHVWRPNFLQVQYLLFLQLDLS